MPEGEIQGVRLDDASPRALASIATEGNHENFLWNTHKYINDYIRFSDTKAGFCLAFESAVLGAAVTARVHDLFLTVPPKSWTAMAWLGASAFILLLVGIIAAVWSVKPRLRNPQGKAYIFWGGIVQHGDGASFWNFLSTKTRTELNEHLAGHVFALGVVASSKYLWVSVGGVKSFV